MIKPSSISNSNPRLTERVLAGLRCDEGLSRIQTLQKLKEESLGEVLDAIGRGDEVCNRLGKLHTIIERARQVAGLPLIVALLWISVISLSAQPYRIQFPEA